MESVLPQYTQLLGLGVFWVSLHCSGMCGPIMASLASGGPLAGAGRWAQAKHRSGRVLSYQLGRAMVYGLLGAAAGLAGVAVEATIRDVAMASGLIVAVGLVASGVVQLPPIQRRLEVRRIKGGRSAWASRMINGVLGRMARWWPGWLPGRMVALGFVMGLLPCMLMFWVLSLSASTASPLHGALLMVGLVGMTTPVLIFVGCAPVIASAKVRGFGQKLLPVAVVASGLWLGLISAAANGWIGHSWVNFEAAGTGFTIMFW